MLAAAKALATKLGWLDDLRQDFYVGGTKDGYVFVVCSAGAMAFNDAG
jgi:hypothetical protein